MAFAFKLEKSLDDTINAVIKREQTALSYAKAWQTAIEPFVPMNTGNLANDVDVYANGGTGYIRYNAPYARAVYYGQSLNFSKEKHSLASAEWDSAARAAGILPMPE